MDPRVIEPTTVRRMQTEARNFAGTGTAAEVYAKVYFQTYVPGKITQFDSLLELNDLIKNATTLLSRAQRSNNPRAPKIVDWMYNGMSAVATGNYHPAARINAMLILGRLDQTPADQITQTPPVPYRKSLPILLTEYNKETNPDGVRAAALQGLHRYVGYGLARLAANEKTAIQGAMTKLLAAPAPDGRSEKVHAFLQRYAVDILDLLRPQQDSALGVQLVSLSTEPKTPSLLALHSAARLGGMSKEMKDKVADPDKVLQSWSMRVIDAFESELARLAALDRPVKSREQPSRPEDFINNKASRTNTDMEEEGGMNNMQAMMGDEDMEGMEDMDESAMMEMNMMMMQQMEGGGGGLISNVKPQPPEVVASRRVINHVLQQIHVGVTGSPTLGMPRRPGGLLAMVNDQQRPVVEDWITAIEPIVKAINEDTLDDREKYVEGITAQLELLREMVPQEEAAAGEAPAEEVDELEALLGAQPPVGNVLNELAGR